MREQAIQAWIAAAVTILLLPLSAAALTAADSFDYGDGTELTGSGSAGGGWGGPWYLGGGSGRVSFSNFAGVAVGGPTTSTRENKRDFATPLSITAGDPTIWLSFDLKVDFDGTIGNSQDTAGLEGAGVYGRLNDPGGNLKWSLFHTLTPPYYDFSTVDVPDDVWSSVCVKLEPTGDGVATYTLWVDPDYGMPDDDPGQVAPLLTGTMDLGNTSIPNVVLYSTYYDSGNVRSTDNLRVSTDSSPFSTEPIAVTAVNVSDVFALAFDSDDGTSYRLQCTTNVQQGTWTDLNIVIEGTGGQELAFDPTYSTQKLYRVSVAQ